MLSALSSFAVSFLLRFALDAVRSWQANRTAVAAGRAEAVAEGAQVARRTVATARQEEDAAAAAHRADPSDAAFDQSFKRD